VRLLVQLEVGEAQGGRLGSVQCGPSQHGPDPGGQLLQAERLGDVVVATQGQPADLVIGRVPGGQEHHRGPHAGLPQPPHHLEAVEVGQHHVEHQQVRLELTGVGHGLGPVGRGGDVKASETQARRKQLDDVGIVLDYEQLRTSLRSLCTGVHADGPPGLDRSASNTHDAILRPVSWLGLTFT